MRPLLESSLLPVPHGFSTRHGGVSEGAFASLNLSAAVGDSPERVAVNLERVAALVDAGPLGIATATQVHGRRVVQIDETRGSAPEADALWSDRPGVGVGVRTADCVPILLVDPEGRRVAAVHSGWKGTELEIAAAAVHQWKALGARPERLLAALGPSIRMCCYEVSEELAQRFREHFGAEVVARDDGKPHLDLVRAIVATLVGQGMRKEHIDVLPQCTACEPDDFFSHRRDHGVTGRHLDFALCRF